MSSDIIVFFPAAIVFVASYYKRRRFEERAWALGMILVQPALMIIDHGHFQVCLWLLHFLLCYNWIFLALLVLVRRLMLDRIALWIRANFVKVYRKVF